MKKLFLFLPFVTLLTTSCGCSPAIDATLTLNTSSLSLYQFQMGRIDYECSDPSAKVSAKSSNSRVLSISATTYNNEIFVQAGQATGEATVTLQAPNSNAVSIKVTIKELPEYVHECSNNYNLAILEADEYIAANEPVFAVPLSIFDSTTPNIDEFISHLELSSLNKMPTTALTTIENDYIYLVCSYFPYAQKFHDSNIKYQDITNVASYLRNKNRHPDMNRVLPIDSAPKFMASITDSDQLFIAVEHGYRPEFADPNSTAAQCYKKARQICLEYMDEDMTSFEKSRAIFEWITEHTYYNHWASDNMPSGENWSIYTDYYLEGPLLHGTGVCDSFSKVYALLAGIEGLNNDITQRVIRTSGYTKENAGHAWNLVNCDQTFATGKFYLACPTWGQLDISKQANVNKLGYDVSLTSYQSFMVGTNYFAQYDSAFSDTNWPIYQSVRATSGIYKQNGKIPAQLDTYNFVSDGITYSGDYLLENINDAKKFADACIHSGINEDFAFNVVINLDAKDRQNIINALINKLTTRYGDNFDVFCQSPSGKLDAVNGYYWIYGLVDA